MTAADTSANERDKLGMRRTLRFLSTLLNITGNGFSICES
jgi:hypothetical protein